MLNEVAPSVMQLATQTHAILFDMPALHGNAALDELLTRLMSSADVVKAGCGIKEDARMLWRSYPDMQAFRVTAGLLDLSKVSPLCQLEDLIWKYSVCKIRGDALLPPCAGGSPWHCHTQ